VTGSARRQPDPHTKLASRRTRVSTCGGGLPGGLVPQRGLSGGGLPTALDQEHGGTGHREQQQDLLHLHRPVRACDRPLESTVSQRTPVGISDHKPWA